MSWFRESASSLPGLPGLRAGGTRLLAPRGLGAARPCPRAAASIPPAAPSTPRAGCPAPSLPCTPKPWLGAGGSRSRAAGGCLGEGGHLWGAHGLAGPQGRWGDSPRGRSRPLGKSILGRCHQSHSAPPPSNLRSRGQGGPWARGGPCPPAPPCRSNGPSLSVLAFINNSVQVFRDQMVYRHFAVM